MKLFKKINENPNSLVVTPSKLYEQLFNYLQGISLNNCVKMFKRCKFTAQKLKNKCGVTENGLKLKIELT